MQLGIISDTHNILPQSILNHFNQVDYILHAGDIGDWDIIEQLKKIAPVIAVYGNIDSSKTKNELQANILIELNGLKIYLTHDIGNFKNFKYELFKKNINADLVIFGHTHEPFYAEYQKTIFLNPGSVSYPRSLKTGTIVLAKIENKIFTHRFINI
jgi:putative phosphoesterase